MKSKMFLMLEPAILVTQLNLPVLAQQNAEYLYFARSETIYMFDLIPSTKWIDGQSTLLVRSIGFPKPEIYNYSSEVDYLYAYKYVTPDSILRWDFVFGDSLNPDFMVVGDFEGYGNAGIISSTSNYFEAGVRLIKYSYSNEKWNKITEIFPYYPGKVFTGRIFNEARDGFIITFSLDTTTVTDSSNYDIEYPPVGMIYGEWNSNQINLYADSTEHNNIQALAVQYGNPSYFYIVEEILDIDPENMIGSLVKYEFDKENKSLIKLYDTIVPSLPGDLFNGHTSRIYISDTLVVLLTNNLRQTFADNGSSLTPLWVQTTPFDCLNASYFDIDRDGKDELICGEPAVKDTVTNDPSWRIKVYKIE